MTTDLVYLVLSTVLCFAQMLVAVFGALQQVGLPALAGNRDDLPEIVGWAGRAMRAHRNMLESLVLLAILVLVAKTAGRSNSITAFGAGLFFWARLVYAGVYVAGIPWVRTGVWGVSVIGLLIVLTQLF